MPSKLLLGNTQLSAYPTIGQWGFSIFETGGVCRAPRPDTPNPRWKDHDYGSGFEGTRAVGVSGLYVFSENESFSGVF